MPELRKGLKEFSNWPTFPQLYVKGELVGGCDIVREMHESRRAAAAAEREGHAARARPDLARGSQGQPAGPAQSAASTAEIGRPSSEPSSRSGT